MRHHELTVLRPLPAFGDVAMAELIFAIRGMLLAALRRAIPSPLTWAHDRTWVQCLLKNPLPPRRSAFEAHPAAMWAAP